MHHVYTRKHFWILVLPMVLIFTLFSTLPLIIAFYYSVTNYRGVGSPVFNGITNYVQMLQDKYVWISVVNTLKSAAAKLIIALPVSFFVAYFVNKKSLRNEVYKVIFFAPYVIPGILMGLIWLFILDPSIGLLNNFLKAIGLDFLAHKWIGGQQLTPYSVAVVNTWGGLGFVMLLWLVGLKGLSEEVLEASQIDGVNRFQQIIYVILPMLKETIKIIVIFVLTGALKIYEVVYILTGGGPNHSSETIITYMFNTIFEAKLYGYGMAIAVLQFVLTLGITLVFLGISRKRMED